MELAGALGDLGTMVPLAAAMIVINQLNPTTVFLWVGLFYLVSGWYYRLPIPVQPLKVVSAIAIAHPDSVNVNVIAAAGIIFGAVLLALSLSGAIAWVARLFTKPVVRGIQLGLGFILLRKGVELVASKNVMEQLGLTTLDFTTNLVVGVAVFVMVLVLLNNRRLPAALMALGLGLAVGLLLGGSSRLGFALGPELPRLVVPTVADYGVALWLLVIPQMPLTIGNACIGTADTTATLFPDSPELGRVKPERFALTMGLVNLPAGFMGAMPMCHGAGGVAAHHRFGARTGGAPIIIGVAFLALALVLGKMSLGILTTIPAAVFGVLLAFAGLEMGLLIKDVKERRELFVTILVAGIAFAAGSMAWAFLVGVAADQLIKRAKIEI